MPRSKFGFRMILREPFRGWNGLLVLSLLLERLSARIRWPYSPHAFKDGVLSLRVGFGLSFREYECFRE